MTRRWVVAAVAASLVVGGLAYAFVGRDGGDSPTTTTTVAPLAVPPDDPGDLSLPPPPRDREEVRRYLAGEGQALVRFLEVTAVLADRSKPPPTAEQCNRIIEVDLAAVAPSPADLRDRAARVPDSESASLFVNDITVKGQLLTACTRGPVPAELLQKVAYTDSLARRRLDQLR